jgi:hypothetical protein
VIWNGGNGPHRYRLDRKHPFGFWELYGEHGNWIGDLDMVFADGRLQKVWIT